MKETKTVQVYPDDNIVNDTIEEYGSFGWEVISNQRCQEFEGQTRDIYDGSTKNHYSTFNKITFTREKSSTWYEGVSQLEKEYNGLKDTIASYKSRKPVLRKPRPQGSMGVALGFLCFAFYIVPGIIYVIVRGCLKSKYKKQYNKELYDYESVYPAKIRELNGRMTDLRVNAERLVLGKA